MLVNIPIVLIAFYWDKGVRQEMVRKGGRWAVEHIR